MNVPIPTGHTALSPGRNPQRRTAVPPATYPFASIGHALQAQGKTNRQIHQVLKTRPVRPNGSHP